jgi:hypothetical protein
VYTEDHGIALYDPSRATFRPIDTTEKQWQVFYSCKAPGGELWGSKYQLTDRQFLFIDIQHDTIIYVDSRANRIITSPLPFHCLQELNWNSKITALDSGRFAINCSNNGFYVFHLDAKTGAVWGEPKKMLPGSEITCLFFDQQRRLWAGTTRGLLRQRLNAPFFHAYALNPGYKNSPYSDGLTCAYRYKDKLYVGRYSRGMGLSILDTATMTDRQDLQFFGEDNMWNEVITIQLYHPDTLWLGTNGGIIWFDTKTNHYGNVLPTLKHIPADIMEQLRYKPTNALNTDLQPTDADGYAWMAFGLRGIVGRYQPKSGDMTFFTMETKPALPFKRVKRVVSDSYGNVWISGQGLARWNSRTQSFDTLITVYGGAGKFNTNILAIAADEAGSLWLHNQQNGLLEYRIAEKRFVDYGAGAGLPSSVFQSMSPVVDHTVWLATGANVTAFDIRNKRAIVYDYGDAGTDDKPTARKIYYDAGGHCFYLFFEKQLLKYSSNPTASGDPGSDILLERLTVNNRQIIAQPADGLSFHPDSNNISLQYAIVDLEDANGYTFSYQLNPNNGWIELGKDRKLTLSDLAPGKYSIQLRAISRSGTRKFRTLNFVIRPHFWQTSWFILLVVVAAALALLFLYYGRIRQIRQKADIDKRLAQMEMKALHAQMNPHFIFNSLNSIKEMVLHDENDEASRYLTKFAQLIRITLDQSVHTFVTLRSTVDYLERYIEMETIRNAWFSCTITVDSSLDENDTILPPMLIQPFIENAIWHGVLPIQKAIEVRVLFKRAEGMLICVVDDNGIGIDRSATEKKAKGVQNLSYGIENVRERIRLLNEKYNLQSQLYIVDKHSAGEQGTGTTVVLELQIQNLNE